MNEHQPTIEALLLDIFGNIVGNKLTDGEKERLLLVCLNLLHEIRQKLDSIERKIDRRYK